MPRLIANEYVYSSGIMDDCYNEYITSTPIQQQQQQHHHIQQQQQLTTAMQTSLQERTIRTKSRSESPSLQTSKNYTQRVSSTSQTNANTKNANFYPEHHIHTISSSGDDEVENEQEVTVEEEIASVLSDGTCDFKGFDDYCVPIGGGLINDANQENIHNSINYLKRHSHTDYDDYREDSEGVVEAIEVEDDDEDIVIGDDGLIMYKSREEVTPVKSQSHRYECNPHTPNKRKKQENDDYLNTISPTHLKTPPDQIVEINSDSTTISQKQKRHQINTKFQLNLSQQQQNQKVNNNKCSTESTSEFPVSSPSNPQQPRGGGKYPPRPPLLKNTLPADSFERQLAMITACNPQMTLAEKIQTWECDDELSDVEDVNMFDEVFRRTEERKKNEFKQKEKCKTTRTTQKSTDLKQLDYSAFRQMIITNMKAQQNLKRFGGGQGGPGQGGLQHGSKGIESSGSESSKSAKHNDHERPSTSAVAQQQLMQQRRSKPQLYLESGETKKRVVKENPKRNQNSTSPPQTSSSDNERDCFQNSKSHTGHDKLQHSRQIQSSSEEANSQDMPTHMQLKTNQRLAQTALNNLRKKSPTRPLTRQDEKNTLSKNERCLTDEEIDSVFRLHRLNPEIDKNPKEKRAQRSETDEEPGCLIQMRLDFANENKTKLSLEKKQELFKTPIIPQKYLPNTSINQTENQTDTCISPSKSVESPSKPLKSTPKSLKHQVTNNEKTASIEEKDLEVVYHQQHEFCNYLGLTGMSTATAMANAVAELAQCNLARRSMRVLRQQQQERKDKSAKEERELRALKLKQLNEIQKRERGGCDVPTQMEETLQKCDEGTLSQSSDLTPSSPSMKEIKLKTSNISTTKSSTKSLNSVRIIKKEPDIKILCHIAANSKEETERLSKECVKEITQPIRETLMRHAKHRKQDQLEKEDQEKETEKNEGKENDSLEQIKAEKVEIKKELHSETKTDCVKNKETVDALPPSVSKKGALENCRFLRSPKLSTNKSELKAAKCSTNVQEDIKKQFKNKFSKQEIMPVESEIESVGDTLSVTNSVDTTSTTISFKLDNANKDETKPKLSGSNDNTITTATTSYILQHKIQMALEESRKSKPSIFIVQSLDCKNELATKSFSHADALDEEANKSNSAVGLKHLQSLLEVDISKSESKSKSLSTKFNKKNLRKVLKKRKSNKHLKSNLRSNPKRQLRKRKIIVIKTTKPQEKLQAKSHEIPRVLRSSPKLESSKSKQALKTELSSSRKSLQSAPPASDETKSYRTVHTETNDLETYLDMHNSQTKTRLMAKASSLLERSRRMSLAGSSANIKSKLSNKVRTKIRLRTTRTPVLKPKVNPSPPSTQIRARDNRKYKSALLSPPHEPRENAVAKTETEVQTNITALNLLDNENVVVSSTTNTYEPFVRQPSPVALRPKRNSALYLMASSPVIETKEQYTQSNVMTSNRIRYLNAPPSATQTMHNPLKSDNGAVLYIFYELDILIVIQERLVSFWKCSKIINMLSLLQPKQQQHHKVNTGLQRSSSVTITTNQNNSDIWCNSQPASSSTFMDMNQCGEWIQLGELRRNNFDFEISVPYANRICVHNSTPIYLEMRARQLPRNHRDCNLLSMYINIYYYHDEDIIAKCNSIQLDTIQSDIQSINFTTLIDSRYFIMTWPQENLLGKTRSGLCKYSLTPQLDTLASIREFKSMRHTIRYLECMSDDKLIGFGESQVTIWDHRSGDVLMNYDLEIPMGRNLGSVYFSSQDIEQNNMIILYQHRDFNKDTPPELTTIACTITHTQSSYRILQQLLLPAPSFKVIKSAINTGDHLVLTGQNDEDIWISTANPSLVTFLPTQENKRFYNRDRPQLIELTEKTLNVDTLANHVLQLAAGLANNSNE